MIKRLKPSTTLGSRLQHNLAADTTQNGTLGLYRASDAKACLDNNSALDNLTKYLQPSSSSLANRNYTRLKFYRQSQSG